MHLNFQSMFEFFYSALALSVIALLELDKFAY